MQHLTTISILLATLVTLLALNNVGAAAYDGTEAMLSLNVACVSFCDPSSYQRVYNGGNRLIDGLNVTLTIHESHYDTYGFVGYLPSAKSIYVVYRGTEGPLNWMSDVEMSLVPYTSFPAGVCTDCKVHRGFYTVLLSDFDNVTREVRRLRALFPTYTVKTTGHSLGGALSQLASMELIARGIPVQSVYNFGQPRTGNVQYAAFATSKGPVTFRHVHYADPVPHLPPPTPTGNTGYAHVCTEMYEPNEVFNGTIQACGDAKSGSCEEKGECMDMWKDSELNTNDHLTYLGVIIKCLLPA